MRVLVATHRSNGSSANDYDFCVEGELVYMQGPCGRDLRDPDGPCGCGRGFSGTNSHRATTTAMVVETELDEADVREALKSSLEAGGWIDRRTDAELAAALVSEFLEDVQLVANHFPVGAVVRRRLSKYYEGMPAT